MAAFDDVEEFGVMDEATMQRIHTIAPPSASATVARIIGKKSLITPKITTPAPRPRLRLGYDHCRRRRS